MKNRTLSQFAQVSLMHHSSATRITYLNIRFFLRMQTIANSVSHRIALQSNLHKYPQSYFDKTIPPIIHYHIIWYSRRHSILHSTLQKSQLFPNNSKRNHLRSIVCCQQTIVCSKETIVWWQQTIVWRHQTI